MSVPEPEAVEARTARLRAGENMTGRTIARRYRLRTLLGVGSMGIVYGGARLKDGKPVAIKVLRSHLRGDGEAILRFQAEATAASAIGNRHIVEVLDHGRLPDGTAYLVMEHLNGAPLSSLIDGEPMPLGRLLHIATQVADALSAVHRSGIVHRDLKPENVLVCRHENGEDFVKIVDFGIAKFGMGQPWLTQVGAIFGTPAYMSPEQAIGEEVDSRTDVYALGVMLYEMACGSLPFNADNARAILAMQATEKPPRLSRRFVGVSRELEAVVHKCLRKARAERYQTMAELAADLTRMAADMPVGAPHTLSSPDIRGTRRQVHDLATVRVEQPKASPGVLPFVLACGLAAAVGAWFLLQPP
jgi:eukaryotic-like serine/threonine-protein kinase